MHFEKYGTRKWLGAMLAAGSISVLAACGGEAGEAPPPVTASAVSVSPSAEVEPSATLTPEPTHEPVCIDENLRVFPGSRLKASNEDDISGQIDALSLAYGDRAVSAGNVVDAIALISNAVVDPKYARAFHFENVQVGTGEQPMSAAQLVEQDYKTADCFTVFQLAEVNDLYQTLVDGYEPKIKKQSSAATKLAYAKLKNGWHTFQEKFSKELHDYFGIEPN